MPMSVFGSSNCDIHASGKCPCYVFYWIIDTIKCILCSNTYKHGLTLLTKLCVDIHLYGNYVQLAIEMWQVNSTWFRSLSMKVKHIDTKQSNKRNNQNSKSKRQDYITWNKETQMTGQHEPLWKPEVKSRGTTYATSPDTPIRIPLDVRIRKVRWMFFKWTVNICDKQIDLPYPTWSQLYVIHMFKGCLVFL